MRIHDKVWTYASFTEWHVLLIDDKYTDSFLSMSATELVCEYNNITTLYGWAEQGERAYAEQAGFATERVNIVAGYNAGTKELIAPLEHSGYMDKQLFTQWICDHLCPALTKGQYVIMDNASIHKDIKIKEAIEKVGCTLVYLPV